MSKITSEVRLKMVGVILGVRKTDVTQFGARSSRLSNLQDRHRYRLHKLLNCLLRGLFAVVWVGDDDEAGLRALLELKETQARSGAIEAKLAESYRRAVGLAFSLRTIDGQRKESHYLQLLSIATDVLSYAETQRLLDNAVSPILLQRHKQTAMSLLLSATAPALASPGATGAVGAAGTAGAAGVAGEEVSGARGVVGVAGVTGAVDVAVSLRLPSVTTERPLPTGHAYKASRLQAVRNGGIGVRINTMPPSDKYHAKGRAGSPGAVSVGKPANA